MDYTLYQGDCLEIMGEIPDGSIDMILCDLPYGTTACYWDAAIPFEPLWEQYERVITDVGAIVLFGTEPFSSTLRTSNMGLYKYDWVWVKSRSFGFPHAKNRPMKAHEIISVFSKGKIKHVGQGGRMQYFPQGLMNYGKVVRGLRDPARDLEGHRLSRPSHKKKYFAEYTNYPVSVLNFPVEPTPKHPTQKPIELCEYLIKTYTSQGELVLDNCMGSGTTGVACLKTGRKFIGIELEEKYFNMAKERIEAQAQLERSRLF